MVERESKKGFVWWFARISFWIIVISLLDSLFIGGNYIPFLGIIFWGSLILNLIVSIMGLKKYGNKSFYVVSSTFSSVIILFLLVAFIFS